MTLIRWLSIQLSFLFEVSGVDKASLLLVKGEEWAKIAASGVVVEDPNLVAANINMTLAPDPHSHSENSDIEEEDQYIQWKTLQK